MEGITVKELCQYCLDLIKEGHGDKTVMISSDDEGNEYHTLFFSFITDSDSIKQVADYGMFHDRQDPENVVLLG